MNRLIPLYDGVTRRIETGLAPWLLPSLARLAFAGVLLGYYWASAWTKLGPGPLGFLTPSAGAYAQIFPRAFEAAGYDEGKLSLFQHLVALAGLWAEFLLPLLIVLGLASRLAALGMIGFVGVQTATDIWGHGLTAADIGRWFDRDPAGLIADQRALWLLPLILIALLGPGPLSLDAAIRRQWASG